MPTVQVHFKASPIGELVWIHVPETELIVLDTLVQNSGTGPEISRATDGKLSPASVYTLLTRLAKRGLVRRNNIVERVRGVDLKRVEYHSLVDHFCNPLAEQNKTAR